MNRLPLVAFCGLLWIPLTTIHPGPAQADSVLECDFDDETIDQPIGIGGASLGQPTYLDGIPAVVRSDPFSTPCLELEDDGSLVAREVHFGFLNDWEIESGLVEIEATLQFDALNLYALQVTERVFFHSYCTLLFLESGAIRHIDGGPFVDQIIGSYTPGQPLRVGILLDLDAEIAWVFLDGVLVLEDDDWGGPHAGVGRVPMGFWQSSPAPGNLNLDRLLVRATDPPTPVEANSWAQVKAAYRE